MVMVMKVMALEVIIGDGSEKSISKASTHAMAMMIKLKMTVMISMMVMTLTCKSLSTSMSLTGRQTAVLQNITWVFSIHTL